MARTTYVLRPHPETGELRLVNINDLHEDPPSPGLTVIGDAHYQGLQALDGTAIDSRTKHRQYMKHNNLTVADDFKESWQKFDKERQIDIAAGKFGMSGMDKSRRSDIVESIQQLKHQTRRDRRR